MNPTAKSIAFGGCAFVLAFTAVYLAETESVARQASNGRTVFRRSGARAIRPLG